MTSDLQSLLAAIVADPADDTARLVYADCLQEHGNSARAEFIRLQVESERHHPDSNERAELEREARTILEENWVSWWAEVCEAVGFPLPVPKPSGRLGRLASFLALRRVAGNPYHLHDWWLTRIGEVPNPQALGGFETVHFRRGFPDAVELNGKSNFLTGWSQASPLHTLTFTAYSDWWHDGSHLAGVRALTLHDYDPPTLLRILHSPHLTKLECLHLVIPGYPGNEDPLAHFATDLERVVAAPRARQLKRLAIPVFSDRAAEVVASAEHLAGLESLEVALLDEYGEDREGAGHRLAILARSPYLAGLKELTVQGGLSTSGITAAVGKPTWTGLRKLDLDLWYNYDYDALDSLRGDAGLRRLEDLRLSGIRLDASELLLLTHSFLLPRLRHLALSCDLVDRTMVAGLHTVGDPERLETFSLVFIGRNSPRAEDLAPLRRRFGNKLRVFLP